MDSSVPTVALPNPSDASSAGTTSLGFHGSHRYHQTAVGLTALPGAPLPASAVLGKFQPGHLLSWLIHPAPPLLSYSTRHRLPAPLLPPSPTHPHLHSPPMSRTLQSTASNPSHGSCHSLELFLCTYFLSHPLRVSFLRTGNLFCFFFFSCCFPRPHQSLASGAHLLNIWEWLSSIRPVLRLCHCLHHGLHW